MQQDQLVQSPDADSLGDAADVPRAAPCPSCGAASAATVPPTFVYALGRVEARFPTASLQKEFVQASARIDLNGKTDGQAFSEVLKRRESRYLARQVCWVLTVQGLDTYLIYPRDPMDLELLPEALGSGGDSMISLVIGVRGQLAGPEACNGLILPVVGFDQIYSFDRQTLLTAIPRPAKPPKGFEAAADELLAKIMQIADNTGSADEHRALNYLVVRYPDLHAAVADAHERNESLSAVDVRPSRLSGARKIVDVILTFSSRVSGVDDKLFVRVDVTEEFPYLVTKLSKYFDR